MNNKSIDKLRVDRRMHSRRGWIDEAELQGELDQLPDVSDKIRPADEADMAASAEAATSTTDTGFAPGTPAPPEGGGA